ncbi:MAG: AtpZ/AtpI family protein [Phycisphaerales bacterium]|nr:AtpZ/AtpI family protein [Phycisphaerales bacterium]
MNESEPTTNPTPQSRDDLVKEVAEIRRLRKGFDRKGSQFGAFANADASLFSLGTQIMSEVIAGAALGWGADALFGTNRRWIVVGAIVGVIVAMLTIARTAIKLTKRQKLEDAKRREERSTHE